VCLAVPARIIELEGDEALAEMSGVRIKVSLVLTPEARLGDYVLIHAGFAINVLNTQEAVETLELFEQLDALHAASRREEEDPGSRAL
jgi:hydrogenase expression/formation protein HypC